MSNTNMDSKKASEKSPTTTPKSSGATLMSLGIFILITLIFFSIRSYLIKGSSRLVTNFVYFGIVVLSQYITNLNAMHIMCNHWQYGLVFFITIIPWVLVFGVISLILTMMPSWLIPFSNTFGYLFAKMSGLSELMKKIMIDPNSVKSKNNDITENQRKIIETLYFINKDPSIIINEFTCFGNSNETDSAGKKIIKCSGNFDTIYNDLSGIIFKQDNAPEDKEAFKNMIEFKETVAEAIWYILFGTYTIMITNMSIVNSGCNTTAAMMRKRYAEYKANMKKNKEERPKNKVYTH